MDDLERMVAEKLVEPFADATPPPDLGSRIVRRAARRRRVLVIAAAAAAVVLVAAPVVLVQSDGESGTQPAVQPSRPRGVEPLAPAGIDELIDPRSLVRIPRRLPSAPPFEAKALGPDGTVLGVVERGSGEQAVPATGVWRVRPGSRTPERVVALPSEYGADLWSMALNGRGYLWPRGTELQCVQPPTTTPERLSAKWGGRAAFYADGNAFVWTEGDATVAVSESCGGPARRFPVRGDLVAFSYPDAFVRAGAKLRRLDVRSGELRNVSAVPASEDAVFTATPTTLAWTDGDALIVQDRRTGATRRALTGLPRAKADDSFHRLAASGQLIVYSAENQDDTGDCEAVVYNLRTGKRTDLPGQAWIAGDWLLWRDGDNHLLARIRQ